MFNRLLAYYRRFGSTPKRHVPSSPELPELWSKDGLQPRLEVLTGADTSVLTAICDDYWGSFLVAQDVSIIRHPDVHHRALEILTTRKNEAVTWACQRLKHENYEAREDAASLIAQLARKGALLDDEQVVAKELRILAVTPPREDSKEAQAATAALIALSIIGGTECMAAVRHVITSADWDDDDNQWECAEILANHTNESFMDSEDPVAAAKEWLQEHPISEC
ncbi:hypothetical protein Pla110_27050 [Polystyrenella longa]|uniref:HEAT repeat protein n=1 Tax=Polystyrenella longa TaxID=2528007 RepID=A0A518CP24_9PLAN|nr:hypothetical protein [Polystyrenella longa]QDU80968.1 hypothetical protein Pla110_27050 [Polystyrenella longa]